MALFFGSRNRREGLDGPVFTKPFSGAEDAIRALSEKLDAAPPQTKSIFRDAIESIREKVRRRKSVVEALVESAQPVLILFDVNVSGKAGSSRIDFVALGPSYILAIRVSDLRAEDARAEPEDFGPKAPYPGVIDSEENAKILLEALRESGHLSGKIQRNVWPVLILSDEEDRERGNTGGSFSSEFSRVFPDIRSAQVISCRELAGLMEALGGPEYASADISAKKLNAMSTFLINYDEEVTTCPASYGTQKKPLLQ